MEHSGSPAVLGRSLALVGPVLEMILHVPQIEALVISGLCHYGGYFFFF